MAVKRLVQTSQLKTTFLASLDRAKPQPLFVSYDKQFDALFILLIPPDQERVAHYVDDHVALLYRPDDLEVVGLQVEDFESGFLPMHYALKKVWKFSGSCIQLEDFGDMLLQIERRKPKVAHEVVNATKELLGEPGEELADVFP